MIIKSINPATEKIIKSYKCDSNKDIKNKIDNSRKAFAQWDNLTVKERCECLRKVASVLREEFLHFFMPITLPIEVQYKRKDLYISFPT